MEDLKRQTVFILGYLSQPKHKSLNRY